MNYTQDIMIFNLFCVLYFREYLQGFVGQKLIMLWLLSDMELKKEVNIGLLRTHLEVFGEKKDI